MTSQPPYADLELAVPTDEEQRRRITPEYVRWLWDVGASPELVAFASSLLPRNSWRRRLARWLGRGR
jgi:hypothetical protein